MKIIENKKRTDNTFEYSVTVEPNELTKNFNEIFTLYSKNVEIKGFRTGKAPKLMIIEKLGSNFLSSKLLDHSLQKSYSKITKKNKIKTVAQPKISITKWVFDAFSESSENNILEYKLEIAVFPKCQLKDYKKLKIDKKLFEKVVVTDQEVETVIEQLQKQRARYNPVSRVSKINDMLEINFTGKIKGIAQEKMTSSNHPLVLGSKSMVPGFEENLIGLKKDAKKKFTITFPKDYYTSELKDQKVDFEVEILEVKEIELPKVDDKFASNFGHGRIDNLKKAIKKSIKNEKEEQKNHKIEAKIINNLLKIFKVAISPIMLDEEQRRLLERLKEQIRKKGLGFENYLKMSGKNESELEKEFGKQARQNIEVGLLLGEIAKRENITDKSEEIGRKTLDKLIDIVKKNSL
ncbi:trigger factor [Candidatus Berkelbacteria bacterium CG10_big_fil_rev_8_21_14_0_10_33_10]|nr:MAG: trigger factor [Candidatus Berkelbacteria bacterium CG10_big_fil_rev_8_21_14_0_10_33_10]